MEVKHIPMFPLSILPLPGELVPLHIFEPRYRQLLTDAETTDVGFGIYFNHSMNEARIGSYMKLESVIKRYPTGESDIVVKCHDIFYMDTLFKTFRSKLYPGGDVRFWEVMLAEMAGGKIGEEFRDYLTQRNITRYEGFFSLYHVAQELNLDLPERYQFLTSDQSARESFLLKKLRFQKHLLTQEERSRNLFHLN
jgi:Lon protease-like protein